MNGRKTRFRLLGLLGAALLLSGIASCVVMPSSPSAESRGGMRPEGTVSPPAPVRGPVDSGLSQAAFKNLPPEARDYLERLSAAFGEGDLQFIAAQGERDYAARVMPQRDTQEYLALLYRVGPYAAETPADPNPLPRFDAGQVRGLRYTGWDERGPLLEVRGLFQLREGKSLPCRIMLLWRLENPKILGVDP